MIIRYLSTTPRIKAGDGSSLSEFVHPRNGPGELVLGYSIAHAFLSLGEKTQPHRLRSSSEVYIILEGRGRIFVEDEEAVVEPVQAVFVPAGAVQHIENCGESNLVFLAIVEPSWSAQDEELV